MIDLRAVATDRNIYMLKISMAVLGIIYQLFA